MLGINNFADWKTRDTLHEAVEALSEKIRSTIKLHYFQGLSVDEISKMQNIPSGTVKWRLNEGRKQLRKEYGVMENFKENATFVEKVMFQVEQLKLWYLKNNKTGFEKDYRKVLDNVAQLEESNEKHHALADVLIRGYWWLPGQRNREVLTRIKNAAEKSRNEEVMQAVVSDEMNKCKKDKRIDFLLETEIPYFEKIGFNKTLGYCWFWLGYYYTLNNRIEEGISAYRKVLSILNEKDVLYANAMSAIEVEKKALTSSGKTGISCTGESFKFINGKTYFWGQPGYARNTLLHDAVFFHCSVCDNLMPYEDMPVGEKIFSSDKKVAMYCKEKGITVETPAGRFENCMSIFFEFYGSFWISYNETVFCPGTGIVKQTIRGIRGQHCWKLKSYKIHGGSGMIPFSKGNFWNYSLDAKGRNLHCDNYFEVVSKDADSAILKSYCITETLGYDEDTWEGNMLKAREKYCCEGGKPLKDILDCFPRAEALAKTKRQKIHTATAKKVMQRIFDTDRVFNPDYTEKGHWNFFNVYTVEFSRNAIRLESDREYAFEWKDMQSYDDEGHKVLYSEIYAFISDNLEAVWSDEWNPGFHKDIWNDFNHDQIKTSLDVLEDEDISLQKGVYKNCRHIHFKVSGYSGGLSYFNGIKDCWYAPDIGIVKCKSTYKNDSLEAVWELTEYEGTGNGYFPVEDGFVRKYEAIPVGNGWHGSAEYIFVKDEEGTVLFRNALGTQDRKNYEANMAKTENA